MPKRVLVLNGPNLNMLGIREPGTYGTVGLPQIEDMCRQQGAALGLEVECRQSNHEGELVTWIQQAMGVFEGIVINAGAYSHTSLAIHDAIKAVGLRVIEVHISNIYAREAFRHHSYISAVAAGVICGLGPAGYSLALHALADNRQT